MTKVLLSSMNSLHRDFELTKDRPTVLHCPEPNADVQRERERERERESERVQSCETIFSTRNLKISSERNLEQSAHTLSLSVVVVVVSFFRRRRATH